MDKVEKRFDFPEYIEYVTAGAGGDTMLVFGSEKTALHDCGMAFCAEKAVDNIEKALEKHGRTGLDYILLSHSHYDHIGGLPYIKKRWPEAVVCGAQKTKDVFARPNAVKLMEELGTVARDLYSDSKKPILAEGFSVDKVVAEGDKIELGDKYFYVLETKGHTDCSLTYVLEPQKIMFLSESTGVFVNENTVNTSILKGYKASMQSAEKCKSYGASRLISPHYGLIPEEVSPRYFDLYAETAGKLRSFLCGLIKQGLTREELLAAFEEKYWSEKLGRGQPKQAFLVNAKATIEMFIKEQTAD